MKYELTFCQIDRKRALKLWFSLVRINPKLYKLEVKRNKFTADVVLSTPSYTDVITLKLKNDFPWKWLT